jgi:chromosome segregation ATPase
MYKTAGKNIQRSRGLSKSVAPDHPLPRAPHEVKIERLEKQLEMYRKANETLRKKLETSADNKLSSRVESLKNENEEYRRTNERLRKRIAEHNRIVGDLNERVSRLENENEYLRNKIDMVEKKQGGTSLGNLAKFKGSIGTKNQSEWQKSLEKYAAKQTEQSGVDVNKNKK